jgi:isoamylase
MHPDGYEMTEADWNNVQTRSLGILLCGDDMGAKAFEGQPITDDTFYLCFNAYHECVVFILPGQPAVRWQLILSTALAEGFVEEEKELPRPSGAETPLEARSCCLFKQVIGSDEEAKTKPVKHEGS